MNDSNPLVSIIIPVFNAEKYVSDAITSAENQTYSNIEILIVDDGSTDSTLEICRKISQEDSRVFVETQTNSGVSSARNRALDTCNGDWIAFLDSDDVMDTDEISTLIDSVRRYHCDLIIFQYATAVHYREKSRDFNRHDGVRHAMTVSQVEACKMALTPDGVKGYVWNKFFSRHIIFGKNESDRLRFNEDVTISEDLLFTIKAFFRAGKIAEIFNKLYFYRDRSGSLVRSISAKTMTQDVAYLEILKILPKEIREYGCAAYAIASLGLSLFFCEKDEMNNAQTYARKFNMYWQEYWDLRKLYSFKIRIKAFLIHSNTNLFFWLWKYVWKVLFKNERDD